MLFTIVIVEISFCKSSVQDYQASGYLGQFAKKKKKILWLNAQEDRGRGQ